MRRGEEKKIQEKPTKTKNRRNKRNFEKCIKCDIVWGNFGGDRENKKGTRTGQVGGPEGQR